MLIPFLYTLNILLLLSGIASIWLKSGERNFSIALLRSLAGLPLLAGEYFYFAYHFETQPAQLILFSEIIFSLLWLCLALRLHNLSDAKTSNSYRYCFIEIPIVAAAMYSLSRGLIYIPDSGLSFKNYSPQYFFAVFILITALYASWCLEQFWRSLNATQRWEYKFFIVGSLFVSGTMLWSASYRLTYLLIPPKHFLLLTSLLLSGWVMILYGVISHRLLNRKIFISRKLVYASVVPSILAAYLLGFGLVSLIIKTFNLELSYVLKWLFLVLGCFSIGFFSFSGKARSRIQFFISTNFYVNKYEYRDEWLALSQELQGALTENDVVAALRQVLSDSLYTTQIYIWTGDPSKGYRLVSAPILSDINNDSNSIAPTDPFIYFILAYSYFHLHDTDPNYAWENVANTNDSLLRKLDLALITPISVGDHLIGLIGLGPEYTGGEYGHDDFDLLTAVGSQTASALMAVRMAEELAHAREQQAWNKLSAFVLHDIKNAATMLSLLQENAPEHIHEPEFQQDMLELMDDALRRMGRVEKRLLTLKDEIEPNLQRLELNQFLETCCHRLEVQLPKIAIQFKYTDEIQVETDPERLFSILENLLLNAFEAQGEGTIIRIKTSMDSDTKRATIVIIDNGPGIKEELLPDILFEPFKTSKKGGSGIGLWQARKVLSSLEGSIYVQNTQQGGAQFTIKLPLQ
ncbi:MAG TPA: PEP-CTERM system histidine kinase PrsK [Desulfocapsa sulfexigens]|nr:PEP-CTERM system histidine kinase PrsK [Desulfocapsa sulfexigens]